MIELLVSIVCLSEIPEISFGHKTFFFCFLFEFLLSLFSKITESGQTEFSKVLLFASEVTEVFMEESDMSETPEVVFLEVSEELVEES